MKKTVVVALSTAVLGCSATIPPDVAAEFSKTLGPECMRIFADVNYQKKTKDVLTPNPVFAIAVGTNKGQKAMVCAFGAFNASSNYNRSKALLTCEQSRQTYMLNNPKAVLEPCEVFAEGYRIVYKTPEAEAIRDSVNSSASPQEQ